MQSTIDFLRRNSNGAILGVAGLYYNKEIFDKFGVGYPKDRMTWPEAAKNKVINTALRDATEAAEKAIEEGNPAGGHLADKRRLADGRGLAESAFVGAVFVYP